MLISTYGYKRFNAQKNTNKISHYFSINNSNIYKNVHDSCFLYLVNYLIERHSPNFSEVPF